ncbi:MAG: hypothetical protein HUU02_11615 [Bacteroidetes bacterium]|nr:hypothetical protein [Bacteroidota bacterium]
MRYILSFLILLPGLLLSQGNLPNSRQATFVEAVTADEVLIKAKGVGGVSGMFGLKEEESVKQAENDARRSAVYFVVYGGAGLDGIVRSEEEKRKFGPVEQELFADAQVQKFIAWEANSFDSRVKLAGGEKIRVEKQFRINRAAIVQYLTDRRVIEKIEDVTEELGLPTLMALPEVKPGQNPLNELRSNPASKQAASVIESYLTKKQFNVVAPEQAQQVYEQQKAQLSVKGHEEDLSYMIALSVGSDIYVSYTVTVDTRKVGTTEVRKASVSVRAYETTTARLLGAETGYSEESAAPANALVEAAVTNALNNVLSRLTAYWQEDLKNGAQYKIIFSITGQFDEDTKYDIADAAAKTLKKIAGRTKENVVADNTIDYLAWIQDKDLQSPSALFRELRREFGNNFTQGKLKQITLNRKLIVVGVE